MSTISKPRPISSFKVMTFDVGGTLIDFETGMLNALRRISSKTASLSDEAIFAPYIIARRKYKGRSSEVLRKVYFDVAKELDLPASEQDADAFAFSILSWPAFSDAIAALKRLRQNFRLVAMTNVDRTTLSAYSHTLENPFHDSISADEAQYPKPDPRYFSYMLGRQSAFGYKQDEILHVAQSQYHDIGVGKELGYACCWIERRHGKNGFGGTPAPASVTKPDYHFHSLQALADAIDAERQAT